MSSPTLASGESPIVGRLEPGERFEQTFDLATGSYLETVVRQLAGDVELHLLAPSGEVLASSDAPGGPSQEEIVAVVTSVAGVYTARVEASSSATVPVEFELRTAAPRRATRRDAGRVEGLRRFQQAMRLMRLQTEASSQEAVGALEQAAAVFAAASEAAWEGRALKEMASALEQLGELDEAREGFDRAVAVLRQADDGAALAEALSSYGSLLAGLRRVRRRDESLSGSHGAVA